MDIGFMGAMLVGGALYLRRSQGKASFLVQLALALSLAGQALLDQRYWRQFPHHGSVTCRDRAEYSLNRFLSGQDPSFSLDPYRRGCAITLVYTNHITYGLQVLAVGLAGASGYVWHEEFTAGSRRIRSGHSSRGLRVDHGNVLSACSFGRSTGVQTAVRARSNLVAGDGGLDRAPRLS